MSRSEDKWFPFFLDLCQHSYSFRYEDSMDHDAMQSVVACTSRREVWTIVNAYKETAFTDEISEYEDTAKRFVVLQERLGWSQDADKTKE